MPTRTFLRDDRETELEIEYTVSGGSAPVTYGPPEYCDPGDPVEVEIDSVRPLPDDKPGVEDPELTPEEYERFVTEVNEDPETWAWDGPDPDDWRDDQFDRGLAA